MASPVTRPTQGNQAWARRAMSSEKGVLEGTGIRVRSWSAVSSGAMGSREDSTGGLVCFAGCLLFQNSVESLCDGRCDSGVAFDAEVQEIGGEVAVEDSGGVEQGGSGVDEVHALSIRESRQEAVHGLAPLAGGIFGAVSAWKDSEEEDFCGGRCGVDVGDDGSDAVGDLFGRGVAVARVVGADEQDDGFWGKAG